EEATTVLPIATEIAKKHGGELVLLASIDAKVGHNAAGGLGHGTTEADVLVRRHASSVPTTVRIERGPAVDRILDVVDEEPIDLVAIASNAKGTFERLVRGSVSDPIIRRSPCPVLVSRIGATAPTLT